METDRKSCVITGDVYAVYKKLRNYRVSIYTVNATLYVDLTQAQIDEVKQITDVDVKYYDKHQYRRIACTEDK